MATSQIAAGSQVQLVSGRIGICLYDNPNVVNNSNQSAYVIFNDSTWQQLRRADLTVLVAGPNGFTEGIGPGT